MIDPRAKPLFQRLFWIVAGGLVAGGIVTAERLASVSTAAGFVIGAVALLPSYLWVRTLHGLPIYPAVSLSYLWTSAIPLIQGHLEVVRYAVTDQLLAVITVVASLSFGTVCWASFNRRRPPARSSCLCIPETRHATPFLVFIAAGCLFFSPLPWMFIEIDGSLYSTTRMAVQALAVLSTTVVAYQWGRRTLSSLAKAVFILLSFLSMVFELTGLMIHPFVMLVFTSAAAYTLGRGRLPLTLIGITCVIISLLHAGKWPMRAAYTGPHAKPVTSYVEFYTEWFAAGLQALDGSVDPDLRRPKHSSALERGSVIQMLLLVQTRSPDPVSYLYGETYALIPELLVPRLLNPNKPWANEATHLLGMHYGLQTRAQTRTTTIGFGPLAESYANFGLLGVFGLGAATGALTGAVARWGTGLPVTSFNGLFGLLTLSAFLQTEGSLSAIVNSLFQGLMTLICVRVVLMRRIMVANTRVSAQSPGASASPRTDQGVGGGR